MIIDQWGKSDVDKINEEVRIEPEDYKYDVVINGKIMAVIQDYWAADTLVQKLNSFNERYRRTLDTFDIGRELEIIYDNKDKPVHSLGSYFS